MHPTFIKKKMKDSYAEMTERPEKSVLEDNVYIL